MSASPDFPQSEPGPTGREPRRHKGTKMAGCKFQSSLCLRAFVVNFPSPGTEAAMGEPIWNQFLTERDKAVFAAAGYGARAGFGTRPAVVVVDVNYNFTD